MTLYSTQFGQVVIDLVPEIPTTGSRSDQQWWEWKRKYSIFPSDAMKLRSSSWRITGQEQHAMGNTTKTFSLASMLL